MSEYDCKTCVKFNQKKQSCRVLREPQPSPCWAYSDDPEFWEHVRIAVKEYQLLHPEQCA